jgi:hypothetical protein
LQKNKQTNKQAKMIRKDNYIIIIIMQKRVTVQEMIAAVVVVGVDQRRVSAILSEIRN